jgi:hypothetical protein
MSSFISGDYNQSKEVFSSILESRNASEEMRGAALWCRAWSYACLGNQDNLINDLNTIAEWIGLYEPCSCASSSQEKGFYFKNSISRIDTHRFVLCNDLQYCENTVDNCRKFMKGMSVIVKDRGARFSLDLFIDGLANKAKDCCIAGGFWRNCVQKMVDVMNEWKMIGIPADPAWD